jgi:hypothetical protein
MDRASKDSHADHFSACECAAGFQQHQRHQIEVHGIRLGNA